MQRARTWVEWMLDKQRGETDPEKRLRAANLEDYAGIEWSTYDGTATYPDYEGDNRPVKDALLEYVQDWKTDGPLTDGIVLLGPAGRGKTLGACLVARDICLAGGWVKYVTHERLMTMEQELIRLDKRGEEFADEYNRLFVKLSFIKDECDLLVLDDVGKAYRSASDWTDNRLDSMLRRRWEAQKATIMTSNVPYASWSDFDPSMASFLYDVGELMLVEGRDYRRASLPAAVERRRERRRAER